MLINALLKKLPFGNFWEKNGNFWQFLRKKWQFSGNFWTFKWQFSGGSATQYRNLNGAVHRTEALVVHNIYMTNQVTIVSKGQTEN